METDGKMMVPTEALMRGLIQNVIALKKGPVYTVPYQAKFNYHLPRFE